MNPTPLHKTIKNTFELSVHNDIMYLVKVNDSDEFKVSDLVLLVSLQREMGGRKLPVLVICNEYASTDVELLSVLSKNENNPYSLADGFVLPSIHQKILANFYLKIKKPERPTRFFNDEEEAKKWLMQFV